MIKTIIKSTFLLCLFQFLINPAQAELASQAVAQSEVQVLLSNHNVTVEYPIALFFNSEGTHVYTFKGTNENPLKQAPFRTSYLTEPMPTQSKPLASNKSSKESHTESKETPASSLQFQDFKAFLSDGYSPQAQANSLGTIVLITIDPRFCQACVQDIESLESFAKEHQLEPLHLNAEFR